MTFSPIPLIQQNVRTVGQISSHANREMKLAVITIFTLYVDKPWDAPAVDRFAQCSVKLFQQQVLRHSARVDWHQCAELGKEFINPPFCLLNQVLKVMESQKSYAAVILTAWKVQISFQTQQLSVAPPLRIPKSISLCTSIGVWPLETCRHNCLENIWQGTWLMPVIGQCSHWHDFGFV